MGKQNQVMMFKNKDHKALTLGDAVPAIVALALIAIIGAVSLLILQNFSSNPVTTPGLAGGAGGFGLYLESGNVVMGGTISTSSPNALVGQASGGAGTVIVSDNSYTGSGIYVLTAGTGDARGGAGTNVINSIMVLTAPAIPFATGALTACANNLVSTPAAGCNGNVIYTQSTTLSSFVNVTNNIVINNGVTLTTMGWDLVAGNAIIVQATGNIVTGSDGLGGSAGSQTTNGGFGAGGTLTSNSFGGSGAGGTGCFTTGGRGGNTLVLGAAGGASGATCSAGTAGTAGTAITAAMTVAANQLLYAAGGQANTLIFLSGSGAGGSSPQFSAAYNGIGNGITGINTILSFQGLLGLVIVAAIIIGVVVGAFAFGTGKGSREEF